MTTTTAREGNENELERESLIVEARQLLASADGAALDETASARFAEIEGRLDELRAQDANTPATVDPTTRPVPGPRPAEDPFAAYGAHPGPPALLPSRDELVELFNASQYRRPSRIQTAEFATVGTGAAGSPDVWVADDRSRLGAIRRLAEFAALSSERVSWGDSVVYPVYGDGAAATAAEGAAKAEYDNITAGSGTPQTIAVWTDVTAQLRSLMGFEGRLRRKLGALIARKEDSLLVSRVLGTTGIQTYTAVAGSGEPYSESLLAAAALVVDSDVGAEPDVAVINPADVIPIFGGSYGTQGETPELPLRLSLHGLACYVSSAVTAGTAVVGSWRAASQLIVGLSPTYVVDPYTGLKNNVVTVLGEEAITLAVDEPSGFVNVAFDDGA